MLEGNGLGSTSWRELLQQPDLSHLAFTDFTIFVPSRIRVILAVPLFGGILSTESTTESRTNPRKILRSQVLVRTENGEISRGRALDISQGGMSMMLEHFIPVNYICQLRVELLLHGQRNLLLANAQVRSCICSQQLCRISFKFLRLIQSQISTINKIP